MSLKFYNTLTKRKDDFSPIKGNIVTIYSCGPTVYDHPHVGNLRAFIFYDVLRRYLKYKGFGIKHVMNITDVDDKTIRNSKKEGVTLREFTEKYTKLFFEDLETMGIEKFEIYPRATEHIDEMVRIIKILLAKEIAYKGKDGSIYFNVRKFDDYGKLSKLNLSQLKSGARVCQDEYTKEEARDFALWKAWSEEDGDVFWETDIGKGRPGWHIECSAMSGKYLGKTIDIHTGGIDLVFPHHENEIAQSEAANGKQFVRFWMHNEHVMVDGQKMSKSLGNFMTLKDLIERGHDPRSIRYALLSTHYRSKLNITDKSIWAGQQAIEKLDNFMNLLKEVTGKKDNPEVKKLISDVRKEFTKSMDDDMNMSLALSKIFDFVRGINKLIDSGNISSDDAGRVAKEMKKFDGVLGVLGKEKSVSNEMARKVIDMVFDLHSLLKEKDISSAKKLDAILGKLNGKEYDPENFDKLMSAVIEIREELRKKKEYNLSDKIRNDMNENGIILEDKAEGVRWRFA